MERGDERTRDRRGSWEGGVGRGFGRPPSRRSLRLAARVELPLGMPGMCHVCCQKSCDEGASCNINVTYFRPSAMCFPFAKSACGVSTKQPLSACHKRVRSVLERIRLGVSSGTVILFWNTQLSAVQLSCQSSNSDHEPKLSLSYQLSLLLLSLSFSVYPPTSVAKGDCAQSTHLFGEFVPGGRLGGTQ